MKLLVTGATGKLGSLVVESLLRRVPAENIVVSVRNPEKAEHFREQGIEVRQGDFDQPKTLQQAFSGIDRLLIISTDGDDETRIRQHAAAVEAAKQANISFIAYTSLANAADSFLFLAPVHQETEKMIQESGIPFCFLRNNWYLENEASTVQAVLSGAPWLTSAESGKVGWALRRDYAEAAAAVLSESGHDNKIYELSGPLMTQNELAAVLEEVIGRDVPVQHVDDAAYADIMKSAGVPETVVPFLVIIQSDIRQNKLAIENSDFEAVLGRPLTSVKEGLQQIVNESKAEQ